MSDSTNEPFDGHNTLGLLGLLLRCALIIPAVAILIVYGFFWFRGYELHRAEWKRIIFYVWIGTMFSLTVYAVRNRRTGGATIEREPPSKEATRFELKESQSPAEKWEQRSSRKLAPRVYLGAVLIPLAGVLIAFVGMSFLNVSLDHNDYKRLVMIYWISSLVVALRLAFGSRKSSKLFH